MYIVLDINITYIIYIIISIIFIDIKNLMVQYST